MREKVHQIIFGADTWPGAIFDIALLIMIILSIVAISMDSVEDIGWKTIAGKRVPGAGNAGSLLSTAKWIFTSLFTAEYLLRIWCVKRPRNYIFSFWGIIDLLAFLPDYLLLLFPGIGAHGFAIIRSLRLIRTFRIFNLGWFQSEADELSEAIWRARAKIIVFLTVVMILVTVTGTLMYEIENSLDTIEAPSQFESIPDGIYWAIVTMTTVGFGDIVPVSIPGKFLSAFLILVGYSLIIVPTGFVSAEVIESRRKSRKRRKKLSVNSCPSCVTEGHDQNATYCKYCGERL